MSEAKVSERDYIDFVLAHPTRVSATEAARCWPEVSDPPAHDAFTRLLHRLEPDPAALWEEARRQVAPGNVLVLDDTTLDKPSARRIELVTQHWSGKHRSVVRGINLITLLWTDGERAVPCDYRLYDKAADGLSKNDHFGDMVRTAAERGMKPECVGFDAWYGSERNLKLIAAQGWTWLTQLKRNRLVNPDRTGNRAVSAAEISAAGTVVHLKDYGMVRVFRIVATDGTTEHWATNDLSMDDLNRQRLSEWVVRIEAYHRGLKQECRVEKSQVRSATAQRNHVGLAIRAFLRLETWCFHMGVSWLEAKLAIIRGAVRRVLNRPWWFSVPAEATA